MLTDSEKEAIEEIVRENPDRRALQQKLANYLKKVMDEIIAGGDTTDDR